VWKQWLIFLGKHKNIITITSSFIVLLSFVVKEGWDEHLKDLIQSIEAAQAKEEREGTRRHMLFLLNEVDQHLEEIREKVVFEKPIDKEEEIVGEYIRVMAENNQSVDNALALATELAEKLPKRRYYATKIELLRDQNNVLNRSFKEWESTTSTDDTVVGEVQALQKRWLKLSDDSIRVLQEAVNDAWDVRNWNERYHRICSYVTYALFLLGWALGLLSNFAGLQTNKPE